MRPFDIIATDTEKDLKGVRLLKHLQYCGYDILTRGMVFVYEGEVEGVAYAFQLKQTVNIKWLLTHFESGVPKIDVEPGSAVSVGTVHPWEVTGERTDVLLSRVRLLRATEQLIYLKHPTV